MRRNLSIFLALAIGATAAMGIASPIQGDVQTKPAVKRPAHRANWLQRMFTAPHRHRHAKTQAPAKPNKKGY